MSLSRREVVVFAASARRRRCTDDCVRDQCKIQLCDAVIVIVRSIRQSPSLSSLLSVVVFVFAHSVSRLYTTTCIQELDLQVAPYNHRYIYFNIYIYAYNLVTSGGISRVEITFGDSMLIRDG